jgi:hypothetical protein
MLKNYIVCLKRKDYICNHNTSHWIVNTKIATKEIPKVFLLLKVSLPVTMYKAPDGGLEAENTK